MSHVRRFLRRLHSFLRPGRAEAELAREVDAHRALLEDEYRRRGLAPADARAAALRAFGGLEASKELQRNERSFVWLEDARRDLRFAVRLLVRSPGFTSVALLTLAISIGANTTIFTVVRSVLLRPLPYPQAERLVFSYDSFPGAGVDRAGTSIPNYLDRLTGVPALESQALYRYTGFRLGQGASAESLTALAVTPSFFRVLRIAPYLGRSFAEQEGEEGHERVAVLSFDLWQQAFGADRGIVGRDVRLSGEPYTIVGVMPESFTFLDPSIRLWVPMTFSAEDRSEGSRFSQNQEQIGRLASGATLALAQQQVDALTASVLERLPANLRPVLENAGYHTRLVPLGDDLVRGVRATLHLLWGGVLLVLLIASANITNLVLVRAISRTRELVTRRALGAGERRLARQLLVETLLLTLVGAALGLAAGWWSLGWVSSLGLTDLPRGHEIGLDRTVVAFTIGLAVVQGAVISVAPLAQLAGLDLNAILREEGRTSTGGRGLGLLRRGLVTVQVALAFVLLIGAGLLFASFRQLLAVDPGFTAEHVLTGSVGLPARYEDDARQSALVSRAVDRLRGLPGVVTAAATSYLPFGFTSASSAILIEGYTLSPGESIVSPSQLRVTPGYFETLGIPLRRGRFFSGSDTADAPHVAIIDERLARKYWPGRDPIGGRIFQPRSAEEVAGPVPEERWIRVVGVVGEVKLKELVAGEETRPGAYYFPFAQRPTDYVGFVVRTSGDPMKTAGSIRQALADLDPELLFDDVRAMPDRIERTLHGRRVPMLLSLAFGVLALLLAAVGIYGVLAYQVSQRTREIGIRMALGCESSRILALVLREGVVLVLLGLGTGVAGVLALRQVIASQLYGVGVLDPLVIASVAGTLLAAALVACLVPARRASRVDPVVALASP